MIKSCSMIMTFYKTDTSVHKCSTIRIDEFQHTIRLPLTFCGFVFHIFTNLWGHPTNKISHSDPPMDRGIGIVLQLKQVFEPYHAMFKEVKKK